MGQRVAAALLALLVLPLSAHGAGFALNCRIRGEGGQPIDKLVHVDPETSTINGAPATITDGRLAWEEAHEKIRLKYAVNRYTGGVLVSVRTIDNSLAPGSYTGDCAL